MENLLAYDIGQGALPFSERKGPPRRGDEYAVKRGRPPPGTRLRLIKRRGAFGVAADGYFRTSEPIAGFAPSTVLSSGNFGGGGMRNNQATIVVLAITMLIVAAIVGAIVLMAPVDEERVTPPVGVTFSRAVAPLYIRERVRFRNGTFYPNAANPQRRTFQFSKSNFLRNTGGVKPYPAASSNQLRICGWVMDARGRVVGNPRPQRKCRFLGNPPPLPAAKIIRWAERATTQTGSCKSETIATNDYPEHLATSLVVTTRKNGVEAGCQGSKVTRQIVEVEPRGATNLFCSHDITERCTTVVSRTCQATGSSTFCPAFSVSK